MLVTATALYWYIYVAIQDVTEQLWDSAVTAYHNTDNMTGLYEAWCWAQRQAPQWVPSNPTCYLSLVQAVTALHHQPLQGQAPLMPVNRHSLHPCVNAISQRCSV